MGIIGSNKQIDRNVIKCDEELKVSIAITATPDIISNPTDIVLVLDRSGSLNGKPLENMKEGAKTFIKIIEEATDGSEDGIIGSGSRIGIVSFSTNATVDAELITSVQDLNTAIDQISAGGFTNHGEAFEKAIGLFDFSLTNQKVIVMFTDGQTTIGPAPNSIAQMAKDMGVIIYCIGLIGNNGINVQELNDWASDPDIVHVAIAPTADDLEEIFAKLAENISKPGATNIIINEIINSEFEITNMLTPSKGNATIIGTNEIKWEIDELGVTESESAIIEFYIKDIGQNSGEIFVNESISYKDDENNIVTFPDPKVIVDCGNIIYPEICPNSQEFIIDACSDTINYDYGEVNLECLGRIVRVNFTLKNICPNKRVAVALSLYEIDNLFNKQKRGIKIFTVPAHNEKSCKNIVIKGIKFVLPEDISLGECKNMCCTRNLKVEILANYIDTDYICPQINDDN